MMSRRHRPAMLAGSVLVLIACAACGSRDTGGTPPATAAQPAGGQANAAQAPSPTPRREPPASTQPRRTPSRAEREDVAAEPEGQAPVITSPPEDRTVRETDPFSLKVAAKGTEPLTYRWTREGRPELVSNDAEFWIANPKLEDAGTYWVEVSNRWGKTTAYCRLTVNPRLKQP